MWNNCYIFSHPSKLCAKLHFFLQSYCFGQYFFVLLCPERLCALTILYLGLAWSNLPSWVFNWCPRHCHWVKYWPQCCYHPVCARNKKKRCSWISNYFGIAVLTCYMTNFLASLGQSCPKPANPPHGNWTCLQQEIPIPGASSFLDGNITSYQGMLPKPLAIYT